MELEESFKFYDNEGHWRKESSLHQLYFMQAKICNMYSEVFMKFEEKHLSIII